MAEQFYKEVLDHIHDGVYLVDQQRRIKYWNRAAEELSGYAASEVLGSCCSDNILVHTDDKGMQLCLTACPLAATMADGQSRQAAVYLRHKAGHRVPVTIKVAPLLNGRGELVGAVETFSDDSFHHSMTARISELEQLSLIDPLTGAGNRRYADMTLATRFNELRRYGWPFGILLCDIDNFKSVNDQYGHQVGDEVLRMVARDIAGGMRSPDSLFFRWGGEEFLLIVAHVDHQQLYAVAERIRLLVTKSAIPLNQERLGVTISLGATLAAPADGPEQMVRRADELLYLSKNAGKNRTTIDGR